MRRLLAGVAVGAGAVSLTACSGGSGKGAGDCFAAWNASQNQIRHALVAHRFKRANVSEWLAQATSTGNVGGRPNRGCGYLFHASSRYLSISGSWRGRTLRWGVPPTIRGAWSAQQQASVRDNATVDARGLLVRR